MSSAASYRAIPRALLDKPRFQRLGERERLLLLVLKLNVATAGIEVRYEDELLPRLARQTGAKPRAIRQSLAVLEREGWLRRARDMIWLVGHLDDDPHASVRNDRHRIGIQRHVAALPPVALVRDFIQANSRWFENVDAERFAGEGYPASSPDASTVALPTHGNATRMAIDGYGKHDDENEDENENNNPRLFAKDERKPDRCTRPAKGAITPTPAEQSVIDAYKAAHPLSRPGSDAHIRLIRRQLGDGYAAHELIEAIEGNMLDEWAVQKGKHELTWVLRNRDNIDRYRSEYQRQTQPATNVDGELSEETLRLVRTS
jgi:hypothetical protein